MNQFLCIHIGIVVLMLGYVISALATYYSSYLKTKYPDWFDAPMIWMFRGLELFGWTVALLGIHLLIISARL